MSLLARCQEEKLILRTQVLKLIILPFIIFSVAVFVVLTQPATAAPPDKPARAISHIAQESGVTLTKQASAETIALGQVVSYTVTIRNEGTETINPTLTDEIPEGLVLQTRIPSTFGQTNLATATVGLVETDENSVFWSGSLAAGKEAVIIYSAIPPTTSSANQIFENVARLEFGGMTLEAGATISTEPPDLNIWRRFVNLLAITLVSFDSVLRNVGLPYAFGFAIILFTLLVRLATFPLNMQQIKSSKAMQELQPKMKELQTKYKNDKEKLAQEQMALYKEHGVNPIGGCLPMVVQMPIWFALYQSLLQLSQEGLLRQGFLWIPSLAGPVSDYSGGIGWLWPLPPSIGWVAALAYLVMPVLLVVSQLYMQQMMMPSNLDPDSPQASMNSVMKFMPLMFGYFALIVPSGLTLYWFTSNLLAIVQQYFTQSQVTSASNEAGTAIGSSAPVNPVPANPVVANSAAGNSASANSGDDQKSIKDGRSKRRKKSRRKR